jgi:hypothetical protein
MHANRYVRIAAFKVSISLVAPVLLLMPALAAIKPELEATRSYDGLAKINVKGIDIAYALPGANLTGYDKIRIDPVEVAFSKNWDTKLGGGNFKLGSEESENIRAGMAKIVNEEFVKELQRKGDCKVVSETGRGVLRIRISIVNLQVSAPGARSSGRMRIYTVSAADMTLFMELYDSESGQIIARLIDRQEARSTGMMPFSNSTVNAAEAEVIAGRWARILRNDLEKARGIGKN